MKELLLNLLRKIARLSRNSGAASGNTFARNAYGELEQKNKSKKNRENKVKKFLSVQKVQK